MVDANCETEPVRYPQTSVVVFILHGGIHYLMFHFLIGAYTWNDLQFLELQVSFCDLLL